MNRLKNNKARSFIEIVILLVAVAFITGVFIFFKPATGLITLKEVSYNEDLNLIFNDSSEYLWNPQYPGDLKSLKITGSFSRGTKASVYLDYNDQTYLIFNSSGIEQEIKNTIIKNKSINKSLSNKSISLTLNYQNNSSYDLDNDGIENLTGIIDFGVNTLFNWNVSYNQLCNKWDVYSIENEESTIICYGNKDCCGLLNLMPERTEWNETFYLNYGKYSSTYNNEISSQIIYANYSLEIPHSDIIYSNKDSLSARFIPVDTEFTNTCVDTCSLPSFNSNSYKIKVNISNGTLNIATISYKLSEKTINEPPILIKNISSMNISKNITMDLNEFFSDPDNNNLIFTHYLIDNITIIINNNLATIIPEKSFIGKRYGFFTADDGSSTAVSNVFEINIIGENDEKPDEELIQLDAEIGKPVRWIKRSKNKSIEIPDNTINLSIKKIINNKRSIINKEKLKIRIKEKKSNKKTLFINETADSYEVEFTTEAPKSTEENITKHNKKVTISSDLSYKNVTAYTRVPESPIDAIRLYWYINKTKTDVTNSSFINLTFIDSNNNSLIDKIKWVVPHLSNQTFEVEINILTIQSYPEKGGNWIVEFNTTGIANLTITAINKTTWTNYSEKGYDLKFLEIKCNNKTMPYSFRESDCSISGNCSIYIENYSCNKTSYEKSLVLTSGKHALKFKFGEQIAYAYNDAGDSPNVTNVNVTPHIPLDGTMVNITANVADSGNVSSVKAMIYYPNGTNFLNLTLINISKNIYSNFSYSVDFYPHGDYTVKIWANDSYGNINDSESSWFAPYLVMNQSQKITINGSLEDWSNLANITDPNEYNSNNDTITDLSNTDTNNWLGSTNIYATKFDSNGSLVYMGAGSGKVGVYNRSDNILHDLSATDPGNWLGSDDIYAMTFDSNNNIMYMGGGSGKFGVYNKSDNTFYDLSGTDSDNWLATNLGEIYGMAFDPNNNLVYVGGGPGKFGVYNRSDNTLHNLSDTDTGDWFGAGYMYDLSFDHYNNLTYVGAESGAFGVYNKSDNTLHDLSDTDPDNWLGSNDVYAMTFDSNNNLTYIGGNNGKFGVYNRSDNTLYNLSGTDSDDWLGSNPIKSLLFDSNNNLVYIGTSNGRFGVYNRSDNMAYNLSGLDSVNWLSSNDVNALTVDTTRDFVFLGQESGGFGVYETISYKNFDIKTLSIANNNSHLFALIQVQDNIEFLDPAKYYRLFVSVNASTGNSTTPNTDTKIAVKYDYRIQIVNNNCYIYNSTDYKNNISTCTISNNSNTLEIGIELLDLNLTTSDTINITSETGSLLQSYDFAPNYASFLRYDLVYNDDQPPIILLNTINNTNISSLNFAFNFTLNDTAGLSNATLWTNFSGNWQANETNKTVLISGQSSLINVTNLPDGVFIWNIYACDYTQSPNCGFSNANYTITVDRIAPAINLGLENNSWQSQSDISFTYTANEDIGIDTCILYGNFSGVWKANLTDTTVTSGVQDTFTPSLADGNYIWNVWCNDTLGNSAWNSTNFTVNVDTTYPTISLNGGTETNNTFFNRSWIYVNVTAYDINENNITFMLVNATDVVDYTVLGSGNRSINFTNLNSNDEYWYNVSIVDKAVNINVTGTRKITLDSKMPGVVLTSPVELGWVSMRDVSFNFTLFEENPDECWLYSNVTSSWTSLRNFTTPIDGDNNITANLSDGSYLWNVWCNDSLGNSRFNDTNFTVNVDTIYPTIEFAGGVEDNNTYFNRSWIYVNVTTFDINENNITFMLVNATDVVDYTVLGSGNRSINFTNLNSNDEYWYNVSIVDKAVNINVTGTRKITLDSKMPGVVLTSPVELGWVSMRDVSFNFTLFEENPGECWLYSNESVSWTSLRNFTAPVDGDNNITANLSDGSYLWNVWCNDSLGNFAWNSTNFTVNVDTVYPTIEFAGDVEDNNTYFNRSWIYVNISAYDINEGNITFMLTNSTHIVNETTLGSGNRSINFTNLNSNDWYWYNVSIVDKTMNLNFTETRKITLDSKMPGVVLTSPFELGWVSMRDVSFNFTLFEENPGECWLYSNESESWTSLRNFTAPVDGDNNITANLSDGSYLWNVWCNDSLGNFAWNSTNFTVNVDTVYPTIEFAGGVEDNNTYFNRSWIYVNVTAYDINEGNVTFYLYDMNLINVNTTTLGAGNRSINFTNLGDNRYSYYVTVIDKSWNGNTTETRIITIDSALPAVSLISPSNDSWVKERNVSFNYTLVEDNPDNCLLYVNISNIWYNVANDSYPLDGRNNFTVNLSDGRYIWNVWCNDSLGNFIWNNTNFTVNVDTVYPKIEFETGTESNGSFFNRSWIYVNVTAYDINEANITFKLINTTGVVNETILGSGNRNINFTNLNSNEWYWYNVTIMDHAYNRNSTETRRITLDSNIPGVVLSYPTNASWVNMRDVSLNFTLIEKNPDNCWLYSNESESWTSLRNFTTPIDGDNNITANLSDGSYLWNIWCNDSLGNSRFNDTNFTVNVDTVYPTIEFAGGTEDNNTYFNRSWIFVNVTAYDINEGNITFKLINTTGVVNETILGSGNRNINFTNLNQNEKYWYNVSIIDYAYNKNTTETRRITLDSKIPGVALTYPVNASWVNMGDVSFNFTLFEENPGECWLYSNESESWTSLRNFTAPVDGNNNITANLSDGSYLWNVWCNDSLGNFAWNSTNFTVNVDTVYPTIEFDSDTQENNSYKYQNWIYINVSINEINKANITFMLINSTDVVNITTINPDTSSINFTNLVSDNEYWYNVTIGDYANNKNYTKTRKITLDSTYPTIEFAGGTEDNNTYFNMNWIYVNISTYDENEANITFMLVNSTHIVNETILKRGNRSINFTNLNSNEEYWYNVSIVDKAMNLNFTETRKITLDSTYPTIEFAGGTEDNNATTSNNWIYVNISTYDENEANVTFMLTNSTHVVNETILGPGNKEISFTNLNSNESYWYNVSIIDKVSNKNSTETRNITLNFTSQVTPPPAEEQASSGGGSKGQTGGGGAASIRNPLIDLDALEEFKSKKRVTLNQTQNDKARFIIKDKEYLIKIVKLKEDSVAIDVAGIYSMFYMGDTKEFDVNNDNTNDISITLRNIIGGSAEITYKLLINPNEMLLSLSPPTTEVNWRNQVRVISSEEHIKTKQDPWIYVAAVLGVILILSLIYVRNLIKK